MIHLEPPVSTTTTRTTETTIRPTVSGVAPAAPDELDPEDDRRTIAGRVGRRGASGTIVVRGLCSAQETWSARRVG